MTGALFGPRGQLAGAFADDPPEILHHTCTTTDGLLWPRAVAIGHSEMPVELLKYTFVLFTLRRLRTFAT